MLIDTQFPYLTFIAIAVRCTAVFHYACYHFLQLYLYARLSWQFASP